MWTIKLVDGAYVLVHDGAEMSRHENSNAAVAALAATINATAAITTDDSTLLDDTWTGDIALSVLTGDGRDFTTTTWTWRDPTVSRLPLMWQEMNEMGHYQSVLAGFFEGVSESGGTVTANGRFFDNDAGRAFRDVIVGAGQWGVSVDPGEYDVEEQCLLWDEESGWCVEYLTKFLAYQIIGVTGTPFPAMEGAYIKLGTPATSTAGGTPAADTGAPSTAADTAPAQTAAGRRAGRKERLLAPARAWFQNPKLPKPTALTIIVDEDSDEFGRVYGHVADKTSCHSSYPGMCQTAPQAVALTRMNYAVRKTTEGDVPTSPLIFGTEHLNDLYASTQAALDHYAYTGAAWADAHFGVDDHGVWFAGALRATVADDDVTLQVLRASVLSGDWREVDGELKLIAALSVNTPGYVIPRALVASGAPVPAQQRSRARIHDGRVVAALGLGMVQRPCGECARRHRKVASGEMSQGSGAVLERLDHIERVLAAQAATLGKVERRSRSIAPSAKVQAERQQLRERVGREHT